MASRRMEEPPGLIDEPDASGGWSRRGRVKSLCNRHNFPRERTSHFFPVGSPRRCPIDAKEVCRSARMILSRRETSGESSRV